MKHLLFGLSVLLLLTNCANVGTPVAEGGNNSNPMISEADSSTGAEASDAKANDAKANDAKDSSEDSKTQADSDDTEKDESKDEAKEEDTAGLEQKNVKLQISDQRTSGQITIKKVETSRDGWVSIHKSRADGSIQQPDGIGEARVDSGNSEDIVVDLWEAPAVGDKLWALLHIDAGERGLYEYPGKDAPVKKNGETVARSFVIQSDKASDKAAAEASDKAAAEAESAE